MRVLGPHPMRLEFQAEADLALAVGDTGVVAGACYLTEGAVTDVAVRPVEDGAVECVEVIDLQQTGEAFAEEELLSRVEVFVVESGASQIVEVSRSISQHVRCRCHEGTCRINLVSNLSQELITSSVVVGGTERNAGNANRALEAVRKRCSVLSNALWCA